MAYLIKFALIISWVLAVASTVLLALSLYFNIEYQSSNERLLDKIKGYEKFWPIKVWFFIALVTWAFIITFS